MAVMRAAYQYAIRAVCLFQKVSFQDGKKDIQALMQNGTEYL